MRCFLSLVIRGHGTRIGSTMVETCECTLESPWKPLFSIWYSQSNFHRNVKELGMAQYEW